MKTKTLFTTCLLFFSLLLASVTYADVMPVGNFSSDATAERFVTLTKEIRCVVCQNQSLAESTAPIANDLRQKIYTMILEKKSDAEIKDYLVKRYGEFILLRPRFNTLTFFLWMFPLLGIGGIMWYFLRTRTTQSAA